MTSAIQDLYPSRVGGQPHILERRDPVVHPTVEQAGPGPLTAADLTSFERDGFFHQERLFSPAEVEEFMAEVRRLSEDDVLRRSPKTVLEPDSNVVRSVFEVQTLSKALATLAADARLVSAMRQILGSEVYLHQTRLNLKPSFSGQGFPWHSDFETWHVEDGMPRQRAVSCSIALTQNYASNGPLLVIPGSHWKYVACGGETPQDHYKHSLRKQEYGVPDKASLTALADAGGIVALQGPPGSVTFFDCNTMHGSGSNITPYPRTNLFFVYNSVENRLVSPFGGMPPRPEFIASRDGAPL